MTKRAPTPTVVVEALRDCAKVLEQHSAAITPDRKRLRSSAAQLLAARGWPSATMGDGMARGTSELTSVERAASRPDPHADIDQRINDLLWLLWHGTTTLHGLVTEVVAHATEDGTARDAHRAGAGACQACDNWCSGAENDRLRAGYCPAHYHQWRRAGQPDRHAFELGVRNQTPKAS